MSISVAMAVCNGEKYIEQQLNSIIHNLSKDDEIIISYNRSEDATLEMIEEAAHQLPIIKVFSCEEKGVIANYENAISHCQNEYIFLADHLFPTAQTAYPALGQLAFRTISQTFS